MGESREDSSVEGLWGLPGDNSAVPGVLRRAGAGNGILVLEDGLLPADRTEFTRTPVIQLRESGSGTQALLLDCVEIDRTPNLVFPYPGPRSQKFAAKYSLVSSLPSETEFPAVYDPEVSKIWCAIDVLDVWGQRGAFLVKEGELVRSEDGGFSLAVSVQWPGRLTSSTSIGRVELEFPPTPFMAEREEVVLKRNPFIRIELSSPVALSELFDRVLYPLREFIGFATESEPSFNRLAVTLASHPNSYLTLWCACDPLDSTNDRHPYTREEARDFVRQGYFSLESIEDRFDETLCRWFELRQEIETALSALRAASDYRSGRNIVDLFLSAAFGAEVMHQALGLPVEVPLSEEARDELVRRLLGTLRPEESGLDWLQTRLRTVVEPTYQARIESLARACPSPLQEALGPGFARRVKQLRNYYAHPSTSARNRPHMDEVWRVSSLLVLVLTNHVLAELGFDEESRSNCIRRCDRFWELVRRGDVTYTRFRDGSERFGSAAYE